MIATFGGVFYLIYQNFCLKRIIRLARSSFYGKHGAGLSVLLARSKFAGWFQVVGFPFGAMINIETFWGGCVKTTIGLWLTDWGREYCGSANSSSWADMRMVLHKFCLQNQSDSSSSSPKTANYIGTLARWISLAVHALCSAGVRVRVKQTHGYTYTPTGRHSATHDRLIGFDPWWEPKLWISADIKLKCDLRHFRLNPVWGGETSSGAVRVDLDWVGNGWWLYVVAV